MKAGVKVALVLVAGIAIVGYVYNFKTSRLTAERLEEIDLETLQLVVLVDKVEGWVGAFDGNANDGFRRVLRHSRKTRSEPQGEAQEQGQSSPETPSAHVCSIRMIPPDIP